MERLLMRPNPISGQPERVGLYLGDTPVGHTLTPELGRAFRLGWLARIGLCRRLPPRAMCGDMRRKWLLGWDRANKRERRRAA